MSGNRGCLANSLLFLVIVFFPVVGHIIETLLILEDDHSLTGTILWLVVIWAIPFFGPLAYLLLGQRGPRRVMFGQPSYGYQQQYQPYQQQRF
jgi:hypothetical protein